VDQQIDALRRPGLQAAVDELLRRLLAHTRHAPDDVPVLLAELTLTDAGAELQPAAASRRPAAEVTGRAA
jgi:hypothetical protein